MLFYGSRPGRFLYDWMTRLGALILMPMMLGAISLVHWGQWSFAPSETHPMGGMEFQVTLLLIALYFVLRGNGIRERNLSPPQATTQRQSVA